MTPLSTPRTMPKKIALIGNHLPRQCGIATFTTDLLNALISEADETECCAVVMNDTPHGYHYPRQVRFEVDQMKLSDYPLAADFQNMNNVDVVCLQHEYGIFGGEDGAYLLKLLTHLRMPIITCQDPPSPDTGRCHLEPTRYAGGGDYGATLVDRHPNRCRRTLRSHR